MTSRAPRVWVSLLLACALSFSGMVSNELNPATASSTSADGKSFDAGMIISDDLFYDSESMSTREVQGLLEQKVSRCRNELSTHDDPITCLRDYSTVSVAKPAESGLCRGYEGGRHQKASEIIDGVARACGISQKVLLVMLEKEQGLVSHEYPSAWRYRTAMGLGCPDGAPCDAQYYGFFNQVYGAARQLKLYAKYPGNYAYRAGRTNRILYHPNAACGSLSVFIENQATASLYIYTPYTPNSAAIDAGYGAGDSCSSYGNRNFSFLFSDWFGSTTRSSHLVKSSRSPDVYLIAENVGVRTRHLVTSVSVLRELAPIGPVVVMNEAALGGIATGFAMEDSTLMDSSSGDVFLARGGTLNRFESCAQMSSLSLSCRGVPLNSRTLGRSYSVGPDLGPFLQAGSSVVYYLHDDTVHEIDEYSDFEFLAERSSAKGIVQLSEARLRALPRGYTYIAPGVGIVSANRVAVASDGGGKVEMNSAQLGRAWSATGELRPVSSQVFNGLSPVGRISTFQVSCPEGDRVTVGGGKVQVVESGSTGLETTQISSVACTAFDGSGTTSRALLVKTVDANRVYWLSSGRFRPVQSWTALVQTVGSDVPIATVAKDVLDAIGIGSGVLAKGSVVKAADSPDLYFVLSDSLRAYVPSLALLSELGLRDADVYTAVGPDELSSSLIADEPLRNVISCEGQVTAYGSGRGTRVSDVSEMGFRPLDASKSACQQLPNAAGATARVFMKEPNSSAIYLLRDGVLRPLKSWGSFLSLGGGQSDWITVSSQTISSYGVGPPL